jgi:hypothetical protein
MWFLFASRVLFVQASLVSEIRFSLETKCRRRELHTSHVTYLENGYIFKKEGGPHELRFCQFADFFLLGLRAFSK